MLLVYLEISGMILTGCAWIPNLDCACCFEEIAYDSSKKIDRWIGRH